jgi:transposase
MTIITNTDDDNSRQLPVALVNEDTDWRQLFEKLQVENKTLGIKLQTLRDENELLTAELELLKEQLALLKAKQFGKSSEKLERQINELECRIEEKEIEQELRGSNNAKDKKQPKRLPLPEDLPREEVLIPAPEVCDECGGQSFRKIADDTSEILEYIPASFKVIKYIRPRCACVICEKIVQGYAPGNTIDKGKAGSGLLAHIMIQKYCNHLPMYRQSQIYEREGITIPRSTMIGWAAKCSNLLEPLIEELKQDKPPTVAA